MCGKSLKLLLKVIQAIIIAFGCHPTDKDTTQFWDRLGEMKLGWSETLY